MLKHSFVPLAMAAFLASAGPAARRHFRTVRGRKSSRRSAARATHPNR